MDKPSGISSARAVSLVKRALPRKTKVGHTGTLDPLASGLLVIMIGRATRLSRYITELGKSYTATARLGATSTTLDAEGEITQLSSPLPTEEEIQETLPRFTGEISQLPPMASAVKVGGERLYKLHRRGVEIEREARRVEISTLELISFDRDSETAVFEVSCGSGTYIRALISDLAISLNSDAYLTALRRTSVGTSSVEKAVSPDDLDVNTIDNHIIPMSEVVSHLPVVEVGAELEGGVRNGRELRVSGVSGSFRVERRGELLAVYAVTGDSGEVGRPEVVLCAV